MPTAEYASTRFDQNIRLYSASTFVNKNISTILLTLLVRIRSPQIYIWTNLEALKIPLDFRSRERAKRIETAERHLESRHHVVDGK
jgi:hypothetical protein